MKLVSLLHEWLEGLSLDIAIALDFGDAIAVIDLAVSTYRDATKAAVALNKIGSMSLHKVVVLGIGGYGAFYLLNSLEEQLVLRLSIVGIASLQHFLAEFEKDRMLALAFDVRDHLLIALSSILLEILEGESGSNRCTNTSIGKEDGIAHNAVEMPFASDLSIGGLVETIDADLYLTDIGRKVTNAFLGPEDAIGKYRCIKAYSESMCQDLVKIGIHQGLTTRECNTLATILFEFCENTKPFFFW